MPSYAGNEKWRKANQNLTVSDDGLSPFKGSFPSLEVNDFLAYLESRGTDKDVCDFVRRLGRELVWAYDNWAKATRDNNAGLLIGDLLNGAFENDSVRRYLTDYAKANNLSAVLPSDEKPMPWHIDENGVPHMVQGVEQINQ